MNFNVEATPDYGLLNVTIPVGEKLKVEASSMASMDSNIEMKTKFKGGLSRFLSKESLFINEFSALGGNGEISIAPGPSGDIGHYKLASNEKFYLTASSFLASTMGVNQELKWQGMTKGLFSGESFFLIRNVGEGDVWFNCYGAMIEMDIEDDYIVDTGHIVAFTEGLDYDVKQFGGYKSLFFSGEGFVAHFRGKGKLWLQSKAPGALVSWADQFRRIEKSNN